MGCGFLLSCWNDGKIYQYGFDGKYIGIKKEGINLLIAYNIDTKGRTVIFSEKEIQIFQ